MYNQREQHDPTAGSTNVNSKIPEAECRTQYYKFSVSIGSAPTIYGAHNTCPAVDTPVLTRTESDMSSSKRDEVLAG